MLLSFFNKTKSLLNSNNSPNADGETISTAFEAISLDQTFNVNDPEELRQTIYDFIRTIRDPEKPSTLEDLNVVYEDGIKITSPTENSVPVIYIEFNPTVPHCSLATLIGLCIRIKLERNIFDKFKLDIFIKKGAHDTEEDINKQINDKERIAAAMENPNLSELVEKCIKEDE